MAFLNKNCLFELTLSYRVRFPFLVLQSQQGSRKISLNSSLAQTLDRIISIHIIPCQSFILLHHCKESQCPYVAAADMHSAAWCSEACSKVSQNTEARRGSEDHPVQAPAQIRCGQRRQIISLLGLPFGVKYTWREVVNP